MHINMQLFQVFNHICVNMHCLLPSKSKQVSVRLLDEEIVKNANDTNKPNHLKLLDYRDEYHGLVDCLNGKQSNYQNLYESLIKRGFKITHWQLTTKEDFEAELDSYIQISW